MSVQIPDPQSNRINDLARELLAAATKQSQDPAFRKAAAIRQWNPENLVVDALANAIAKSRIDAGVYDLSAGIAQVKNSTPKQIR